MENLKFLNNLVNNIEDYYGVKIEAEDANSIQTRIYDSIITRNVYLPKYYKIRHKGQVVEGKLGNIHISKLMIIREMYENIKFTEADWEQCLLPLSDKLFFCEESQTIYDNIDYNIGKYLVRHNCSDLIFRFASYTTLMPKLKGETVKILDTLIKKETSINAKKCMIDDESLGDIDDELWIIRYLESVYTDGKIKVGLNLKERSKLSTIAEQYELSYEDLSFRVQTGMKASDTVKICKHEHNKYGIKYSQIGNVNFIAYLEYLANKESKQ